MNRLGGGPMALASFVPTGLHDVALVRVCPLREIANLSLSETFY